MRFYAEIAKMIESPVFDPKIHSRIYVECESKPRDMPLHGVFWKPADE
jgi:hypothetical protein